NITDAVSKSSKYKFSNPSCSSMYNQDLGIFDKSWLSAIKSDVETSKGFLKIPSRYSNPAANSPILLMSSILSLVKLMKSEVRTHTHQALVTSSLPYMCKLSTSDNKNAGTHLEFLHGIQFSGRLVSDFTSYHIEKILKEFNSKLLKENFHIERECSNNNENLILYTHEYKKIELPSRETVRFDILITKILDSFGIVFPLDVYFNRLHKVGVISIFDCSPLCEKFNYTPLTRHWLLQEYHQYWKQKLSAEIDGNVPIFGVTANLLRFANHSATAKLTAGVFGVKHALSFPISCKVNNFSSQYQALIYPQNHLVKYMLHPFQLAVVCVASLSSCGVEDGLIVSKKARDLGFGMTISQVPTLSLNLTSFSCEKIEIIFFNENNARENDYKKIFSFDKKDLEDPEFYAEITINRKKIKNKFVLCDILGVENLMSFSLNLSAVHIGSSARIFYDNAYDLEEEKENMLSVSVEKAFLFRKKSEIVLNFVLSSTKLLDLGDKFSTTDGQKATVVNVMPVEDMPFFSSKNERIPTTPDIVINISSNKRQTLGLNIGGAVNMLKLEYPDEIDMSLFSGDKSVRHINLLQYLLKLCLEKKIIATEKIFDGTTGKLFADSSGKAIRGDIYLIPFLRYEQQGNKVASFTKGESVQRTLHGGFVVKSRGKKGGLKIGQADQFVLISEGSIPSLMKQNQLKSEPILDSDRYTGMITQSACAAMKTYDMLDYDVKIF
ncbi:hypothetical protein B4U79_16972, partial [Dinothrombium tinctorium]